MIPAPTMSMLRWQCEQFPYCMNCKANTLSVRKYFEDDTSSDDVCVWCQEIKGDFHGD